MNNLFRKILLTAIVAFGFVVMANSALAVDPNLLSVDFEGDNPGNQLFGETNFLPGDTVSRWAKVTNLTDHNLIVKVVVNNFVQTGNMASQINFVIKKTGGAEAFSGTLQSLYNAGITTLDPALPIGATLQQYDFSATFKPESNNDFMNMGVSFNIDIGADDGNGGMTQAVIINDTDGSGGGGTGGYFSPTPTPVGKVKGESVSREEEAGQTGGRLSGGGVFVAAAETGPTELISPTPAAGAVAGESTCLPIWWWPFGYVLLLIILGTAQKMGKRVSTGGIVLQIVLLIAALLWWWLEPCRTHFWVWPVLILIVFLVSFRFYLKKSSSEEISA